MAPVPANYEEALITIANTRLVYNTMEELESALDNHSIHNNGIRRSFPSPQKLRAAFRDLKEEVLLQTDGYINLERALRHYRKAWTFFRQNLYRRTTPEQVVLEIMAYCYPPYIREGLGAKRAAIYDQIVEQDVSVPFLLLLLLKALPGYDSKEGDATDMPMHYDRTLAVLEAFIAGTPSLCLAPIFAQIKDEPHKTRLNLLMHVANFLDTYKAYTDQACMYDLSSGLKASQVQLDIDGLWNECGGKPLSTSFWQIENALRPGSYFLTHWHKDAAGRLTGTRYTLFAMEGPDGRLVFYLLHPEAIRQRMKGQPYRDADHVWYTTEMPGDRPDELPLKRQMYSAVWPQEIKLTRCTEAKTLAVYEHWLDGSLEVVKLYEHLEYTFVPSICAITQTHIYIPSENDGEYYKVPRSAHDGFDRIHIDDNVGTMQMNGKTYLVFDEFLLYLPTTRKTLQEYGIERVRSID